ncbi:HTH domain-containing protein [Echinicola soli]|uniref:HTH domain-containing protein n=1 Tax=Echinicola soli TaxID=2591634 RepID=A0A514CH40_9BACT|nr:HTH domain-containing protein [Echinicola soli]
MRFIERKEKLDYLLELIEKGRCISLSQVANNFEVSRRTVKRMIAELRDQGYKISYCKVSMRFFLNEK